MRRKILVLLLVLAGCASAPHAGKDFSFQKQAEPVGVLTGSISTDDPGNFFSQETELDFESEAVGQGQPFGKVSINNHYCRSDEDFKEACGRVFTVVLKPGTYGLYWHIASTFGLLGQLDPGGWEAPQYTVQAGKVTYVGNIHMVFDDNITGKGPDSWHAWPHVSDQHERDLPVLYQRVPALQQQEVSMQVVPLPPPADLCEPGLLRDYMPLAVYGENCSGDVTSAAGTRWDEVPMYGQPEVPRPPLQQQGDQQFIQDASKIFGGDRKKACQAWTTKGDEEFDHGNDGIAMRRYNEAWLLDPDSYLPYWGFGRVLLDEGKTDEAIVYLEKSAKMVDDAYQKPALLTDLGTAYAVKVMGIPADQTDARARYTQLSDQSYDEASHLDATYTETWRRWAIALYREGRYAESWQRVKQARTAHAPPFSDKFLQDLRAKLPEPP